MTSSQAQTVTLLLQRWRDGNRQALDELISVVYGDLRRIAARLLSMERAGHTLSATAVVHEGFLRLVDANIACENRTHFYAVAARVLRRVLVEHANVRNRQKRGGGMERVPFDEALTVGADASEIVIDLDEAMTRLAIHDARKSEILQLMYFGGLTYDEIAETLGISPATVHRELKVAKAWLHRELNRHAN